MSTRLLRFAQATDIQWLSSAFVGRSVVSLPQTASKAGFASAAGAATKEGSEAKKEAKKTALQSFFGAVKVTGVNGLRRCAMQMHCSYKLHGMQTILTSRVAVLGAGAACLLVANVQTGSVIEDYYKGQAS